MNYQMAPCTATGATQTTENGRTAILSAPNSHQKTTASSTGINAHSMLYSVQEIFWRTLYGLIAGIGAGYTTSPSVGPPDQRIYLLRWTYQPGDITEPVYTTHSKKRVFNRSDSTRHLSTSICAHGGNGMDRRRLGRYGRRSLHGPYLKLCK